jgi:hypothetical protein
MTIYIFDINASICPSNQPIDASFKYVFENWQGKNKTCLVTNNTYDNILPRIGRRIIDQSVATFTCGGNMVRMAGKDAIVDTWRASPDIISYLESILKTSEFKIRSGPNIEYRTGMISFSVVGKAATEEERNRYKNWDKTNRERKTIIDYINKNFNDVTAIITGDTSVDVCRKNHDKSQVFQYFQKEDNIVYVTNKQGMYNIKNIWHNVSVVEVDDWKKTEAFIARKFK